MLSKRTSEKDFLRILHEADEILENLQCYGKIDTNSNGAGTNKWAHTLKVMMINVQISYTNN
jgi:hypothetical protein